jgi:hypothetical protein
MFVSSQPTHLVERLRFSKIYLVSCAALFVVIAGLHFLLQFRHEAMPGAKTRLRQRRDMPAHESSEIPRPIPNALLG